jgi:signal transduction histidine kinase/CheY-like chemotaxis protein
MEGSRGLDPHPPHPFVLLLVPEGAAPDSLEAAAAEASQACGVPVKVVITARDMRDALREARLEYKGVPLAYLDLDEETALDALECGADDADALRAPAKVALTSLVRRTLIRAHERLHNERLHSVAAHAEKLTALGMLVASVAHEINNPCAALLLSIEVIRRRLAPLLTIPQTAEEAAVAQARITQIGATLGARGFGADLQQMLDDMVGATNAITDIVRDLRVFARSEDEDEEEEHKPIDVHSLIDQALRIAGSSIGARGHIERDYADDLPRVAVSRSRLLQVLTNVIANAAQAIHEIERPVHRVRVSTRSDAEGVVITIADTGPGIRSDRLGRIFDPFFTTKKAGEGTGLGLALSADFVRRMGGQLIVESDFGEGATFLLFLPLPASPVAAISEPPSEPRATPHPSRRPVVLAVDDDERVLRAYARALRERYDVLLASDGQEAIDLLRSGSHADAVVTDLEMPEVDGRGLFAWLLRERPELARRLVFVTAIPLTASEGRDGPAVLLKPVPHDLLLRTCADLIGDEPG